MALAALWAAPTQAADYGLYVCGVQVTDENKDDLSVIDGVTVDEAKGGAATYDPATQTLHLKNARLEQPGDDACIWNESISGLAVEVEGACVMESKECGISMSAPTTITGKPGAEAPSLGITSSDNCGIYVYNAASCTISGLDLTATGEWGIAGDDGTSEALAIEDATVRATGRQGSICDFASVTSEGCKLVTPEGAWLFNGTLVGEDDQVVTSEVLISRAYGLFVCGVQVTDENKDDLSAIDGVTGGAATYDPATKTLRLKDAVIEPTGNGTCVGNKSVDGLTIEVEGECRMTSDNNRNALLMEAPTTITGKSGTGVPSLGIAAKDMVSVFVYKGTSCTIRGLDLTATGKYGISGYDGTREALTIENATVRATGENGSICHFKSVTLKDCQVVTPAGAAFINGTLRKDGKLVTEEAVILPDTAVGIGTTASDAPRREGTYTLSGVRLATPLDQLPRGIYVVDGQKVVRK